MTSTIDISYIHMLLGFLLLLIPLYFLYYYRTGLIRETIIAAVRMTVQLFFIGFYLEYLFTWNNIYINILWVLIMIGIASYTILQRTKLPVRQLLTPVIAAFLCAYSSLIYISWELSYVRPIFWKPAILFPLAV